MAMKHLLSALLAIALCASASATQRTPLATIPGPPGGTEGDTSVAAQNGILAIAYANKAPKVYLYSVPNWTQVIATLTISDPNALIESIAIQNDYVVVAAVDTNTWIGSVYVFTKPGSGWASESETAVLLPAIHSAGDGFPSSISVWGDTVLVSAAVSGIAYIFVEPVGGWVNATENAQLTPSDSPFVFGQSASLTGSVGDGGSLAVVGGESSGDHHNSLAYVYTQPNGGWASMTQTAELNSGPCDCGSVVSAAKSTIAVNTGTWHYSEPPPQIFIFTEPEGGWVNSSSPKFTASALNALSFSTLTLSQNAEVLVSGIGYSSFKRDDADLAYLWHASKDFGSSPIILSAWGLTTLLQQTTVTADYAFAWDDAGNVFVFDGK
jgi:hypothetical protein